MLRNLACVYNACTHWLKGLNVIYIQGHCCCVVDRCLRGVVSHVAVDNLHCC